MLKKIILLLLFSSSLAAFAASPQVYSYQLNNGLKLLIKPVHRAPVVVSQLWYKVGSAYEPNGLTGISHVLEHLMFAGTKKYPEGKLAELIQTHGGQQNATTSYDYTMYYEILPANQLALSFKLEADRMANLQLTQKKLARTLNVVKEEKRLRLDNNPHAVTMNRFNALAFISSPYHHAPIGWLSDLNHLTLKDIKHWYKTWYTPNNAVLVVAGDVQPKAVLKLARHYFGKLKSHPVPQIKPMSEQTHFGLRKLNLNLPAHLPFLVAGYNVPSYRTADEKWQPYALFVTSAILGGSESSRLQSRLVRGKEKAVFASTGYSLFKQFDSEFKLLAIPAPKQSIKSVKAALLKQIKQLSQHPVSQTELNRVKAQVVANRIYQHDSLFSQAREIGHLAALNLPWQLSEKFTNNIQAVTAKQIQTVVQHYFVPANLTIAELTPDENH